MLSQHDADTLLAMTKIARESIVYFYPSIGELTEIPLVSPNNQETFIFSLRRGSIDIRKNTYQTRARRTIVLARLDIAGAPHCNPDGIDIPCPHIHLYRAGFDDKWAIPLPELFRNHTDYWQLLHDFMLFCNIQAVDIRRDNRI
jgi:hypothetical protein